MPLHDGRPKVQLTLFTIFDFVAVRPMATAPVQQAGPKYSKSAVLPASHFGRVLYCLQFVLLSDISVPAHQGQS